MKTTTTTLKLTFVHATPLARLYRHEESRKEQWVPRSEKVVKRLIKPPGDSVRGDVHEVEIMDWWLDENPFEVPPGGQRELI